MSNKKYIDFPAGTYDTSKIFLQGDASTGALEKINLPPVFSPVSTMQLLGSSIIAQSAFLDITRIISTVFMLTDGTLRLIAIPFPTTTTINGVLWFQTTQGVYTADNYNGIGLYTYSAGVLTLVASSTNDGNIWKASSSTWNSVAFSSSYAATPNLYFIALLFNQSALTTAPQLGAATAVISAPVLQFDFTNSAKLYAFVNGHSTLPSTLNMSACTGSSVLPYVALY